MTTLEIIPMLQDNPNDMVFKDHYVELFLSPTDSSFIGKSCLHAFIFQF